MPAPTYQRIADDLRRAILDGSLPPGVKLPSRHELARQYGVSDRVAVEAVRVLAAEGFAETRSGSGSYVRQRPEMQRLTRAWYTTRRGGSPFRAEMGAAGRAGSWECSTERTGMPPAIAARLGAEPGDAAMRTRYTFTADGAPVMLSVSWEPLELTGGTPVTLPEEGPHAGRGVVERMAVIGQQITSAEEVVSARPALAAEADRLNMRTGGTVLTICRTYRTDERAVETADIVIPVERYSLVYEIPVGLPHRLVRPSGSWCGSSARGYSGRCGGELVPASAARRASWCPSSAWCRCPSSVRCPSSARCGGELVRVLGPVRPPSSARYACRAGTPSSAWCPSPGPVSSARWCAGAFAAASSAWCPAPAGPVPVSSAAVASWGPVLGAGASPAWCRPR